MCIYQDSFDNNNALWLHVHGCTRSTVRGKIIRGYLTPLARFEVLQMAEQQVRF